MIQVTPKTIRRNFNIAIKAISQSSEQYLRHPDRDFTRKRKLPFESVLKLLVSMGGNTLCKELHARMHFDGERIRRSFHH